MSQVIRVMPKLIEITTKRLYMRQWQETDHEPFALICSDPKVMEFLLPVPTLAASDSLIDNWSSHISRCGWGFWATELRESREFIGFIGIQVPHLLYPFSPCVEIGWRLSQKHWGNGYATEGASAALYVAFQFLDLPEIVALTAVNNQSSLAVMKRIGMIKAEEFNHPARPVGHPLCLHYLYRLTQKDWLAQEQALLSTASAIVEISSKVIIRMEQGS